MSRSTVRQNNQQQAELGCRFQLSVPCGPLFDSFLQYHKLRCPTLPKAPPSRGRKATSNLRIDQGEVQKDFPMSATGQVAIPRLGAQEPAATASKPAKRLCRTTKTSGSAVLPLTVVPTVSESVATPNIDTFWSHDTVAALDSLPSAVALSSAVSVASGDPFDFHSAEIGNTLSVYQPTIAGSRLSTSVGSSGPVTRRSPMNAPAPALTSTSIPMQRSHAYPTRNTRFSSSAAAASSPLHAMAMVNSTMIAMASGGRRKLNSAAEVSEMAVNDVALSQSETGISRAELEQLFDDYSSQASREEKSSLIPDQVEPEWMWSADKIFGKQQLSLLKMQMCNNFQIVAQAYVMEKEMHGADAYETQHWEDQLRALESLRDFGIKSVGPTSFCNVLPVSRFDQVAALQSNARNQSRSEAARTFIKCMSYQHTESEYKERMAKQLETSLGQKTRSGKARSAEARWSSAAFSVAPLFEGLFKLQEICRTGWSVELVPNILRMRKKKVLDFLPHEDALLLRGLICFGAADLDSIRALCLPSKTIAAISGRIKALTARGKEGNALKSLLLRPFKPLTILEKDLMRVGIATNGHGHLPKLLKLFRHHPLPILRAEWERMHMLQEIATTFPTIMDTEALVLSVDGLPEIYDEDDDDDDDDYDMDESDSDEDADDDDGAPGADSRDIFAFINEEAFADEDDTDDDFELDDSALLDLASSDGSADGIAETMSLREQKLSAAGMEVMLALQPHQKDKLVKRKSYVPKLVPQNQEAISEAGNENCWSFSASQKESLGRSGSRLRKVSLAVHTGNSTVGRGRIRGKKKTAVVNPCLTDKASPNQAAKLDSLFKKPHPVSYAPFNLLTSPTKHINSASSSYSHSLPLPGTAQSNFLSSEADFDPYELWVDFDNCANADDVQPANRI
ncbi:hypothetical protein BC830DRAFT_517508 [Chytriomyces sp. MP71]|nr:hypothetical protein BC830DRAFT_517508 [Chytriomyces sp. MP71]